MFSDDIVNMEEPTDFIISFYESMLANQISEQTLIPYDQAKIHPEYLINDYIIYNSYRAIIEL